MESRLWHRGHRVFCAAAARHGGRFAWLFEVLHLVGKIGHFPLLQMFFFVRRMPHRELALFRVPVRRMHTYWNAPRTRAFIGRLFCLSGSTKTHGDT